MDIPKTKGYTCFVKIAECALEGDTVKARRYINKFIAMYPESDLIYPFQHLLDGIKNPDGLTLDQIIPLPSDNVCVAYGEGYEKGCEDTITKLESEIAQLKAEIEKQENYERIKLMKKYGVTESDVDAAVSICEGKEEICDCENGGIWLDGYYDTHCDFCKKRLK